MFGFISSFFDHRFVSTQNWLQVLLLLVANDLFVETTTWKLTVCDIAVGSYE